MHMAVHRKALVRLPPSHGTNAPVQVGSNFLPRIQAVGRRLAHSRMVMGQTWPKRATHCFDPLCRLRRASTLLTFAVATSERPCRRSTMRFQTIALAVAIRIRVGSRAGDRRLSTRVRARGRRGSRGVRNRAAGLREWRAFPDDGGRPLEDADGNRPHPAKHRDRRSHRRLDGTNSLSPDFGHRLLDADTGEYRPSSILRDSSRFRTRDASRRHVSLRHRPAHRDRQGTVHLVDRIDGPKVRCDLTVVSTGMTADGNVAADYTGECRFKNK